MHYHNRKLPWYRRLVDAWRVLTYPRYALFVFNRRGHALSIRTSIDEAVFCRDKLQVGINETNGMYDALDEAKQLIDRLHD